MSTPASTYRSKGYVILPGIFGAGAVQELAAECDRLLKLDTLIHSDNIRCRWANHVVTDECRFDCFDPVADLSPLVERVAHDPSLLAALKTLYGEPAKLFKDKLIFKPPGAPGYELHQDYIAWADFPRSFMTVMIAIDPSTLESGATEVFAGFSECLSPEDGEFHRLPAEVLGDAKGEHLALAPGDVACFSATTPHRSAPNRSAQWRRLLYLSYNAASDGGDQRRSHYDQYHAWLREKYAQHGKTAVYFR